MTLDIKALREKAKKATPGEWIDAPAMILHGQEYGPRRIKPVDPDHWLKRTGSGGANSYSEAIVVFDGLDDDDANAAFIAAANPATVIALIARCERAEALLGEARDTLRPFATLAQEQITEEYQNAGADEHGCVEVYDSAEISTCFEDCDRARATLARIDAALGAGGEG